MAHLAIPEEIPVMTLPDIVLFPQAMLPLFVFEPRYRQMLDDVLDSHRLFAVARQNEQTPGTASGDEPPHNVATVGIVRACHTNDDGTSNLILQGLARVHFEEILRETPYRTVRVRALPSQEDISSTETRKLRASLKALIRLHHQLGVPHLTEEVLQFLSNLRDAETFLDLSAFTLCQDSDEKQHILELLSLSERFQAFMRYLRTENERIQLENKLQGNLDEDDFSLN